MTAWGKRERAGERFAPGTQAPQTYSLAATSRPVIQLGGLRRRGERIGKVIL